MTMNFPTSLGIGALALWSSLALLAANSVAMPPFFLLALCFFVSFLISLFWRYKKTGTWLKAPKITKAQWLLGIYGLFGYHFCYFFALHFAPVLEVSLINYLWPLLLSIFVAAKGHKLVSILGGIVAFSGIVILLSGEQASLIQGSNQAINQGNNQSNIWGYSLAFGAAFIWASYSALLAKFSQNQSSDLTDIGWISLVVSLLSGLCHLLFEPNIAQTLNTLTFTEVVSQFAIVLVIGLGPLGSAFYLWEYGMSKGNRSILASLSFLTPLASSFLLAGFGFAEWSLHMLVALTLILLGGLVSHSKSWLLKSRQKQVKAL